MPFSRSRSIESITRSSTSWLARNAPDCHSIASTSVVLPWSTWATIATLRRSSRGAGGAGLWGGRRRRGAKIGTRASPIKGKSDATNDLHPWRHRLHRPGGRRAGRRGGVRGQGPGAQRGLERAAGGTGRAAGERGGGRPARVDRRPARRRRADRPAAARAAQAADAARDGRHLRSPPGVHGRAARRARVVARGRAPAAVLGQWRRRPAT